jgi:hypothetical protein
MFQDCVFLLPSISEYWDGGHSSMAHCLSTSPTSSLATSLRLVDLLSISGSISSASCCRKGTQHATCVSKILNFLADLFKLYKTEHQIP